MVASSQRTALLEKYRYINVDHGDWWDSVESVFVEDMKKVGIQVNTIYFSGFSSQGDGACFVGQLSNALTYLDHHHVDQYPMIRKLLEHDGEVYVKCKHSGHYYHENCTEFWADSDTLTGMVDQPTEFHEAIVEEWQRLLEDEVNNFETDATEQWRTYMQQLYRKLEAEYDHLTSDDAVWDTIEANELIEEVEEEDA
jgi:hypothetical protein